MSRYRKWLVLAGFVSSALAFISFESSLSVLQLPMLLLALLANIILFVSEAGVRRSHE